MRMVPHDAERRRAWVRYPNIAGAVGAPGLVVAEHDTVYHVRFADGVLTGEYATGCCNVHKDDCVFYDPADPT
jgi:hypothetical protein